MKRELAPNSPTCPYVHFLSIYRQNEGNKSQHSREDEEEKNPKLGRYSPECRLAYSREGLVNFRQSLTKPCDHISSYENGSINIFALLYNFLMKMDAKYFWPTIFLIISVFPHRSFFFPPASTNMPLLL